ncbi:Prolyl endopeptidase [Globisporangium polare]
MVGVTDGSSAIAYPAVKRSDFAEELHGVRVADPYRWLEDPDSDETKAFVEAQNAVTQQVFDQVPYVEETKVRMTELFNYEKYSAPKKYGGKYVFAKNDGLQNQYVYYIQDTLESEPRVLLDPNLLSTDGTAALSSRAFSEAKLGDGKLYFAHGISRGGSDWQTIKVLAVHDDNKVLEDTVEWVKFSAIAWTHDDKGFFYSRYPPPENLAKADDDEENSKRGTETDSNLNHQLWYHALHTPQSQDKLVYAYPAEPSHSITAEVSDDGKKLIVSLNDGCKNANMVHLADLSDFDAFLASPSKDYIAVRKLVDDMDASFSYILNQGDAYYFQTNKDAPRERVVRADISTSDPVVWEEVIPEQKDLVVLEGVHPVAGDLLVLQLLKDVVNVLHVYDLNGVFQYEIDLPSVGTVGVSSKRSESELFIHFISFLYPGSILRFDLSNGKTNGELFRETKVKGFDPSLFEAKQVFYPSKDGTKIPMFIVKSKSSPLNGELPVYLYGYGGFNISLSPAFSVARLVFVQHFGGVLALPNLRGGGEYGEDWHQDGMLFKKQNVFDDFHAAAEYLIKEGYTNSSKIAIHGGSNGGLLVAATSNQRPDLYRCAVGAVGVMDMLRFHKFTIGHAWRTDYGDPDVAEDFQYLLKYSPVHNVPHTDSEAIKRLTNGGFPSVLLTTGDHDDRVVPLHSYKLIAELQHQLGSSPSQKNPLIIRIDTKSGHGAGKPLAKTIEENSEVFAFIAWNLGAKFIQ